MHVPEIRRRAVPQGLGNDLSQALGRKGVIRQPRQRQPLETHLTTVPLLPGPDRTQIVAAAVEHGFDLMEVPVDPVHRVVLADVFPEIKERLRLDPQAKFFEHLAPDGIPQRLAVVLSAAGQDQELAFLGPDPDREDLLAPQDDRTGGRADARRRAA